MTQSYTLHDLIRMIGNGDPSAHEALYMRIRQPVMRQILWKFGSVLTKEDAQDILHNSFIKIVQYAARYNGTHNEASAKSWIYRIAQSEALKMIHAQKRTPNSLDGLHDFENESESSFAAPERSSLLSDLKWEGENSVESRVFESVLTEKVISCVQRFSVEERHMLVLRFSNGYTFEEIGRQIGRTKPRAKQIIDGLVEKIRRITGVVLSQD